MTGDLTPCDNSLCACHDAVTKHGRGSHDESSHGRRSAANVTYTTSYRKDPYGEPAESGVAWAVAKDDDEVIGALQWDYEAEPPVVRDLSVDERYRRQGVATQLFAAAKKVQPSLVHSDVLTDEGRQFRESFAKHGRKGEPGYSLLHPGRDASTWAPTMSRIDAEAWAKDSAINVPLTFVGRRGSIAKIKESGFHDPLASDRKHSAGSVWGRGIYLGFADLQAEEDDYDRDYLDAYDEWNTRWSQAIDAANAAYDEQQQILDAKRYPERATGQDWEEVDAKITWEEYSEGIAAITNTRDAVLQQWRENNPEPDAPTTLSDPSINQYGPMKLEYTTDAEWREYDRAFDEWSNQMREALLAQGLTVGRGAWNDAQREYSAANPAPVAPGSNVFAQAVLVRAKVDKVAHINVPPGASQPELHGYLEIPGFKEAWESRENHIPGSTYVDPWTAAEILREMGFDALLITQYYERTTGLRIDRGQGYDHGTGGPQLIVWDPKKLTVIADETPRYMSEVYKHGNKGEPGYFLLHPDNDNPVPLIDKERFVNLVETIRINWDDANIKRAEFLAAKYVADPSFREGAGLPRKIETPKDWERVHDAAVDHYAAEHIKIHGPNAAAKVERERQKAIRDISTPAPKWTNPTWWQMVEQHFVEAINNPDMEIDADTVQAWSEVAQAAAPNYEMYTRVSPNVLTNVLADGKFLSQHDTGTSNGMYSPRARSIAEYMLHGVDVPETDEGTIFGYLDRDGSGKISDAIEAENDPYGSGHDPVDQYGEIAVKFKESVRERTTFSIGDSLDQSGVFYLGRTLPNPWVANDELDQHIVANDEWVKFSPVPLTNPTFHAWSPSEIAGEGWASVDPDDWWEGADPYVEAQYHGGVTVDDIEKVILKQETVERYPSVLESLQDAEIPFQILGWDDEDGVVDVTTNYTGGPHEAIADRIKRIKGWMNEEKLAGRRLAVPDSPYEWKIIDYTFDAQKGRMPKRGFSDTGFGGVYSLQVEALHPDDGSQIFTGVVDVDAGSREDPIVHSYQFWAGDSDPMFQIVDFFNRLVAEPKSPSGWWTVSKHGGTSHDQSSHGNWATEDRDVDQALLDTLFPDGALITTVPWKRMPRHKTMRPYDMDKVLDMLSSRPNELVDVDPSSLYAMQGMVTRAGVSHYLDPDNIESGKRYGSDNRINVHPTVYRRRDGRTLILSGHHRAAAAMLRGVPLRARVISEIPGDEFFKHGQKGTPGYHLLHPRSRSGEINVATFGDRARNNALAWMAEREITPDLLYRNTAAVLDRAEQRSLDYGKDWYANAHRVAENLASDSGVSTAQAAGVLAALSPRNKWRYPDDPRYLTHGNIADSFKVMDAVANPVKVHVNEAAAARAKKLYKIDIAPGEYWTHEVDPRTQAAIDPRTGGLPDNLIKAYLIARGGDPDEVLGGAKVRSFYNNILFVDDSVSVTVDTHQVRVMMGRIDLPDKFYEEIATNPARYEYFADVVRQLAADRNMPPHMVQAIVWEQWRLEHPEDVRSKENASNIVAAKDVTLGTVTYTAPEVAKTPKRRKAT